MQKDGDGRWVVSAVVPGTGSQGLDSRAGSGRMDASAGWCCSQAGVQQAATRFQSAVDGVLWVVDVG